jgi:D-lactate dehydrogenase (cytochrome)
MIRARAPRGTAASSSASIRSGATVDRSPDRIAAHLEDAAHFPGGFADGVARPSSETEIAALLAAATTEQPVLPIGAQSSLTGGATPHGGVVLSTDRFSEIGRVESGHVHVGAGVPLSVLQEALAREHRWYPPVPTFTGAFMGGVVATNAAGAATFKYGATRRWTEGLTVVLACGCVLDLVRGEARAHRDRGWELECAHGTRSIMPGTYRPPQVAKCSAGYFAADNMDLIDLFIGSEGTLGVITDVVVATRPAPPAMAMALITVTSDDAALEITADLRAAAEDTWRSGDSAGLDVSAIEYIDRRCIEMIREDGADRRLKIQIAGDAAAVLFVHLELPQDSTAESLYAEIAGFGPDSPDSPVTRLCRLAVRHGVLDRVEMAMPGDRQRMEQLLALREAAPMAANRRVGDAKRDVDSRIQKTAADMIVPFDALGDTMAMYRAGYARRGLDCAIWGHISDGNLHPNVLPRQYADVDAGKDAIFEFAREVVKRGGCPLAEHGVGRSPVKQRLLAELYGPAAIDEMRAIKRAFDPGCVLAPGVLF